MKSRIFNIVITAKLIEEHEPDDIAKLVLESLQKNGFPRGAARIDVQGYDEGTIADMIREDQEIDNIVDQAPNRTLN